MGFATSSSRLVITQISTNSTPSAEIWASRVSRLGQVCPRADPDVNPYVAAGDLFRLAVDRLVNSKFHSGENPDGKRYWEWHHLFKAKEYKSPTKLRGYWLNDNNFRSQSARRSA